MLAGNVLLAVQVARALTARSAPRPAAPVAVTKALPAPVVAKATRSRPREGPSAPAPTAAPVAPADFQWAAVESADFLSYLQNLRAIGVPEDIVRDLVRAEVTRRYRPRQIALWQTTRSSTNYWENGLGAWEMRQPTLQVRRQMAALFRAMATEVKAILGEDALFRDGPLNEFCAGLSPELRRQVIALGEAHEAKVEVFDLSAFYDEEAGRGRKQADREYYAALAKLLPADQYEAFALRYSDTASNLRDEFRGFTPTEEEFKALYRLRTAREAAEPLDAPPAKLSADEIKRLKQAENEAVVAALGPERAKEFEVLQNNQLHSLIESGVPTADLLRMDAMNKSLLAAAEQLKANSALTAAQRTAAQAALRLEVERELTQLLGERRANLFLSSRAPRYFGEIMRRPKEARP